MSHLRCAKFVPNRHLPIPILSPGMAAFSKPKYGRELFEKLWPYTCLRPRIVTWWRYKVSKCTSVFDLAHLLSIFVRGLKLDGFEYPIDVDRYSLIPSWTEHFVDKTVYRLISRWVTTRKNLPRRFEAIIMKICF